MTKLTLSDLANLENQSSAVATINANNALIENALEITLSRDATTPNIMVADLDMNSNRILNLNAATSDTEPVRQAEFNAALDSISGGEGVSFASGMETYGIAYATDTATVTSTDALTDGQLVIGQTGAIPLNKTITGDVTLTAAGVTSLASSLSLTTPTLGVATATSINKMAITAPASSSTLAVANGKTFTASNTLTLAGTDSTTMTFPTTSSTVVTTGNTATLVAGYSATSFSAGTKATGTFTPDPASGNFQHYTNGGAHTLAPPASVCTMILECTNASAGALTTSGFSIVSGDLYSSTGTKKHIFYITKTNSFSELNVKYVTGT